MALLRGYNIPCGELVIHKGRAYSSFYMNL